MRRPRLVENRRRSQRGQSTIEFALVFPMVVLSAAVIIAVVSVCISVLNLNDTARILARSASTADDPVATASDLGSRLGVRTTTHLDPDTRIITVTVTKSIRVWFLGSRIPSVVIRSASSILSEPQVVLGQ